MRDSAVNASQSIILGDLSGLQDFLFDVAFVGSGQARRLRARSLLISLLAETAALRVIAAVGWSRGNLVFSAAGKFLLAGPKLPDAARMAVKDSAAEISQWLYAETGAALRPALAIADTAPGKPLSDASEAAQLSLQRAKWQPWKDAFSSQGQWLTSRLVLPPISPPCDLCRRRLGRHREQDEGNEERLLCDRCFQDGEIGRDLANARWIELLPQPILGTADVLGFGMRMANSDRPSPEAQHVFSLSGTYPVTDHRIIRRRLARHIPRHADGQLVEFKDLAARAQGSPLLGVLKMDADNLGIAFRAVVEGTSNLEGIKRLSERLDDFFARAVDEMLAQPPFDSLYMIFSGGDDLLLVGPWNVAFDFAGHAQQTFSRLFANDPLTLSGGFALIKPMHPIRNAADQAEDALERAKFQIAAGSNAPKDQFCAFGHVWKWRDHAVVVETAGRLANWVKQGVMPRGWLQTLLELAEQRNSVTGPVTARLAYHIGRNFPTDKAPGQKGELRRWGNDLLKDFDAARQPETRLLPAILRHTLTATRSKSTNEL